LKPAARALASLLWAQKQDNVDMSALSGAQHLAGSGRTSFAVDKQLHRDAYRVLGYRQCGERAVRVDILERLADLIRPALSWRETSPGTKPAGAFDGRSFVVTQAMTSLTGSAGEDFASILRALGYRMERRAPPPPKPVEAVEPVAAEAAPAEVTAEAPVGEGAAETAIEALAVETAALPVSGDPAPSAALLPEVTPAPAVVEEAPVAVEAEPEPASIEVPVAEAAPEQAAVEATPENAAASETAAADASVADAPQAAAEASATPELVEVWRPGRSEERRPRHDRHHQRHQGHPALQDGAQPAVAALGESGEGAKPERQRHGRRDRNRDFRKPREGAPVEATASPAADGAPAREPREDKGARPPRERFEGKGRDRDKGRDERPKGKFGGGRDNGGRDKRDSGPSHRQFATTASPRERDRPADPNSPFAKLAALKEQLTANRKDR
jgi:ATP-dependent RNA helicase SUPV3L1/SUV3